MPKLSKACLLGCSLGLWALWCPSGPGQEPEPLTVPRPETPSKAVELRLEPPTPEELFRVESAAALRQRLAGELRRRGLPDEFPPAVAERSPAFRPRAFPSCLARVVPLLVCHRPLYFEDRLTERYGWYAPGLQPFLSTGKFYVDTLLLPCHLLTRPPWLRQCEADTEDPDVELP